MRNCRSPGLSHKGEGMSLNRHSGGYQPFSILSPMRVCRNEGNAMLVILNPSPVILNEVKNLYHWLRVNSVKNLIESIS